MGRVLRATMGTAARRPRLVGGLVALLAVAGAVLALRLEPTTATGTLVQRGSPTWQATEDVHQRFGDDAIYVLVREKVSDLVLTADLGRLLLLEGCLSGNRPAGAKVTGGARGPCGRLAATKPVQVVFGPATFLNTAVGQIQDQFTAQTQQRTAQAKRAAAAARGLALRQGRSRADADRLGREASQLVYTQALQAIARLAAQYGLSGVPSLDDSSFIAHVVPSSSSPTLSQVSFTRAERPHRRPPPGRRAVRPSLRTRGSGRSPDGDGLVVDQPAHLGVHHTDLPPVVRPGRLHDPAELRDPGRPDAEPVPRWDAPAAEPGRSDRASAARRPYDDPPPATSRTRMLTTTGSSTPSAR